MVQRRLTFANTRDDVDMAYFITPSTSGLKSRSGEGGAEVIADGCKTSLNVLTRANFFDGFSLKGELRYSTKSYVSLVSDQSTKHHSLTDSSGAPPWCSRYRGL